MDARIMDHQVCSPVKASWAGKDRNSCTGGRQRVVRGKRCHDFMESAHWSVIYRARSHLWRVDCDDFPMCSLLHTPDRRSISDGFMSGRLFLTTNRATLCTTSGGGPTGLALRASEPKTLHQTNPALLAPRVRVQPGRARLAYRHMVAPQIDTW